MAQRNTTEWTRLPPRMKAASSVLAVLVLLSCVAAQQAAPAQPKLGSVSGRVVTTSGQPLHKTTVFLHSPAPKYELRTTKTDEKGRFAFAAVQTGAYSMWAQKSGHLPENPSARETVLKLAAGQPSSSVVLKLVAAAIVTGHVTNENGEAMVGVEVASWRQDPASAKEVYDRGTASRPEGGRPVNTPSTQLLKAGYAPARKTYTDDRGEFRLYNLPPGRYRLEVSGRSMGGKRYGSEFYPAARSSPDDASLEVMPGEELSINFRLQPVAIPRRPEVAETTNPASVSGLVVSPDGSPLAGVRVTLLNLLTGGGGSPYSRSAISDENGRFEFGGLGAGFCYINGEKAGYTSGLERGRTGGLQQEISAGERREGVLLKMFPLSSITGRVLSEDDEPLDDIEVLALRRDTSGNRAYSARRATSDDRGNFRLHSLPPGQYYLMAFSPSHLPVGKTYARVFYPKAPSLEGAVALQVRPGEELFTKLAMRRARGYAIRGRVLGAPQGQTPSVTLELKDSGLDLRGLVWATVKADGSFEFKNIQPGKYVATAQVSAPRPKPVVNGGPPSSPPPREAQTDLEVSDKDVEGVQITVAEPAETVKISGRVRCECPAGVKLERASVFFGSPAIAADFRRAPHLGPSQWVDKDTEFAFSADLPIGARAYVSAYMLATGLSGEKVSSYYTKSVTLAGKEAPDGEFTVSRDMAAMPMEIVVSTATPIITGVVLDDDDRPVTNATIFAVPEERWRTRSSGFVQARTDPKGEFRITQHRPGEYTLVALERWDVLPDAEFLKKHASACQTVSAKENGHYRVTLHLVEPEGR